MKKWIWGAVVLTIIMAAISMAVYTKAREPISGLEQTARTRAIQETDMTAIQKVYTYNGSKTIQTVVGTTKEGEQIIVWIPEKKGEDLIVKAGQDGISEKAALEKVKTEANPKEILGIELGLEQGLPVWEISYLDDKDLLNYYYIHFETGKWWRKIENL